jgi:hypothetical protein
MMNMKQSEPEEGKQCDDVPLRKFDLNIEKILENWEVHHAIREIIANALDEHLLTKTEDISIFKDAENKWHVRDYGRGIRYQHFTQKEDEEKLKDPYVIGKFGIGLKDALATFDRKRVKVLINSRFGDISLGRSEKHDFKDIVTLHAYLSPPSHPNFIGTEFILDGVSDNDVANAKDLFLRFSGEKVIEGTTYGEVLEKITEASRIYINGARVAEEDNFLFSYNITSLTKAIRTALNRERTNVGRTAYAERVKSTLLECRSKEVGQRLVEDLRDYESGKTHDELKWLDVQERAVQILNAQKQVVFLTPEELTSETMMVDEAKQAGYEIVPIPKSLKDRIRGLKDTAGDTVRDLSQFHKEYSESFQFKFVDPNDLESSERGVFNMTEPIFKLIGGKPKAIKKIMISETMKKELGSFLEVQGLWEARTGKIIVKRSALSSLDNYVGTLLHEVAHAICGADDVSRQFELELTRIVGLIGSQALKQR